MHRHRSRVPSPWITRHAGLIATGARALDLACGSGRHTRYLRGRGCRVTAIDIDTSGLADLADDPLVEIAELDLEQPGTAPLAGRRFDAVVVTDYLFRPLLAPLVDCLEPGGVFLYETFALGNERFGRPPQPGLSARAGRAAGAGRGQAHRHRLRAPRHPAAHAEDRAAPLRPQACGVRDGKGPGARARRLRERQGIRPLQPAARRGSSSLSAGGRKARSCASAGIAARTWSTRDSSRSAIAMPTPSPPSASTSPQGSTMSEWP